MTSLISSIKQLEIILGRCSRRWSWWWVVEFLRGGPRAGVCGVVKRRRRRRRRGGGTRPVLGARLGPPPLNPALYRPFSADPTLVGDAHAPRQSPVMFHSGEKSECPFLWPRERGVKFRDIFASCVICAQDDWGSWPSLPYPSNRSVSSGAFKCKLQCNFHKRINIHPKMVAYEED